MIEDRDCDAGRSSPLRWVWSQHWLDVLFLHWRVGAADLRSYIPSPLEVQEYAGAAWVSLVLFRLRVRPRGFPFLPGLSNLLEANLRTYVQSQDRPGIWFLDVLADNRFAIEAARRLTPMPYRRAEICYTADHSGYRYHIRRGTDILVCQIKTDGVQELLATPSLEALSAPKGPRRVARGASPWNGSRVSHLAPEGRQNEAGSVAPSGLTIESVSPGIQGLTPLATCCAPFVGVCKWEDSRNVSLAFESGIVQPVSAVALDSWLLERYRLYIGGRRGLMYADVEHPPWMIREIELTRFSNTIGEGLGLELRRTPDLVHWSPGVQARFGAFRRLAQQRIEIEV